MRHIFEDQIDGAIWTFSVENIKGKRDDTTEFRVPLSAEVMKVIKQARCLFKSDFILSFPDRTFISKNG
ncbi:hypothetical protein KAE70_01645 [Bartonella henselae]|uniref:hypothetical protein n=1 Tax=Bartonella henselae TaxID=38323 RepID=UPI000959E23F|nr:hypothetical protein [Bartonella henselae]OLL54590.1 hypothetical protein AT240_00730 [Bartonella henselae]OLL56256.1 hypothetical protein AT239_04330 [Bartonella henselae]UJM33244.1 hypothetical protein KAE70_01645 [Bartonella henselae]